ncbi:uncharacterized protein LOC111241243 isoform X1 [Vigna radiata var. radiata]|uniref:Uncharacterized protein LOC111241243 isoform X1 n=1 Tax=Vigna radiata var. radiata TaxID=3916 RepID=A0A3Q0EU54_VIGRR|nr:uncharacterized protein LOC111241243 isoform X1 [Vigna radiata var. radiata]
MELSACSMEGMTPPKTMKLVGWVGGRRVVALIDSGASHNFISKDLAEDVKLPVIETSSLGDGPKKVTQGPCDKIQLSLGKATVLEDFYLFDLDGVDIILDTAWLAKLGEVVINLTEITTSYYLAGKMVKVRGDHALSRKLVEPKTLLANSETWTLLWDLDLVEKHAHSEWPDDLVER